MKKILLGTTTLIGAAGLFAGAALAETPKVTVGGYANFQAGYVNDDLDNRSSGSNGVTQRPHAFRSDTQVDFKIDGKNDMGLGYGGEIDLLADTSGDVQGRGFNASKTFIYMDGMWGRFELGSNVGADGTMKIDAATIARATGGINGDWTYFANASNPFIAQAALPLAYGRAGRGLTGGTLINTVGGGNFLGNHTEENLNKITYYTPRFAGFQVGVSYLPDEQNRGQGTTTPLANVGTPFANTFGNSQVPGPDRSSKNAARSQNIVTGGLSYDNKFGDWGFAAAATGEYGKAQNSRYEDLAAWNAGAKLSWMGWSFAGSYGNWGKSNRFRGDNADTNGSRYYTAGVAYEYGPFGASVTYLNSRYDCGTDIDLNCGNISPTTGAASPNAGRNKFHNISVGTDYKLAPGLTPYAEVSFFDQNSSGQINDNRGTVGLVGTQLNF